MNSVKLNLLLLVAPSIVFLNSCADKPATEEAQISWDQLKTDAKATYVDVLEVSKEKWSELKAFSSEEWQDTERSFVELKDKVVASGNDAQPKVEQLLRDAEQLRQSAADQLEDFQKASGDKAEASKEKLEKTWRQLQEKMQTVRDAITDES